MLTKKSAISHRERDRINGVLFPGRADRRRLDYRRPFFEKDAIMKLNTSTKIYCLMASVTFLGAAVPSLAQSDSEEIVVTGRYGTVPDSVQSLSAPVSYADLDLSTGAGRDEFKHRLHLTARYLCNKLGETDNLGAAPPCEDAAYQDAMQRAGTMWEHFAPRGTAWVAPRHWTPPYPADWETRYP
jgi:UrcA family protein